MAQGSVKQGNHRGRWTLIGLSNNRGPLLGTLQPIADQIAVEASQKLGTEISISFDKLFASDLSGRARAFQSIVGGGMPTDKAAGLAGLLESE